MSENTKKVSRREKKLAALQLLWKRGTLHEKDAAEAHAILKYLNEKELEWGGGGRWGGRGCAGKKNMITRVKSITSSITCAVC